MKRIIYLICFLAVTFHAWSPISLIFSPEIPQEYIGKTMEIKEIIEIGTRDILSASNNKSSNNINQCLYFKDMDEDDITYCKVSIERKSYAFLDINKDDKKDLIIKIDTDSGGCYYGCPYSDSTFILVALAGESEDFNFKLKGRKRISQLYLFRGQSGQVPREDIFKRGGTLVIHDHIRRFSLVPGLDYFHRPKRISINNLLKDSFYDTLFPDESFYDALFSDENV